MRNVDSHFSMNPVSQDISRSTFLQKWSHLTTCNAGKLIPVSIQEVLPGDTFSLDTNVIARMTTPIVPVMDDAYLDIYHFFVPNRLVWKHWKNLMGENTDSAWVSDTVYQVPHITYNTSSSNTLVGTNVDYFGLPVGLLYSNDSYFIPLGNISVNALPFRGLRLIWNEWFRDQNVSDPKLINDGDTETDTTLFDLYPVGKFHDYFTSVLPSPQKGPSVPLPVTGTAPVIPGLNMHTGNNFLRFNVTDNGLATNDTLPLGISGLSSGNDTTVKGFDNALSGVGLTINGTNLEANFDSVTLGTINQLRQAFQVQKLYERDARGGTRYIEQIRSHFGVISPDARMQRPEYLGGERVNVNITQVVQTSGTIDGSGDTPQGNTAAYSLTRSRQNSYTKSFTEHGFVFCLCCIRTHQSYCQGINRMWSRKNRLDYYYPVFANLGEQAVLNKEIYARGYDDIQNTDDEVFGYQEAWAEYRYTPSTISGAFRPNFAGGSLAFWHYGNDFRSLPTYSEEFIYENDENVKRTLAVSAADGEDPSSVPQFILSFSFVNKATRKIPMYSIPGLIDHH